MKNFTTAVVVALGLYVHVSAAGQPLGGDYDAAIQILASRPQVRQALELARDLEADAEATLIELTEIPAPPFGEAERAQKFASLLREVVLRDVTVDAVGNVVARRPGRGRGETIAIVAHLDLILEREHRRASREFAMHAVFGEVVKLVTIIFTEDVALALLLAEVVSWSFLIHRERHGVLRGRLTGSEDAQQGEGTHTMKGEQVQRRDIHGHAPRFGAYMFMWGR